MAGEGEEAGWQSAIKIHAFPRLASNGKNNSWREWDGGAMHGHMFETPAHNGWLWLPASGATK